MTARSIYKVSMRKRSERSKNGRFKTRHCDPQLIEIEPSTNSAEELATAVSDVITKQYNSAANPIDKIEIELIGTLT